MQHVQYERARPPPRLPREKHEAISKQTVGKTPARSETQRQKCRIAAIKTLRQRDEFRFPDYLRPGLIKYYDTKVLSSDFEKRFCKQLLTELKKCLKCQKSTLRKKRRQGIFSPAFLGMLQYMCQGRLSPRATVKILVVIKKL